MNELKTSKREYWERVNSNSGKESEPSPFAKSSLMFMKEVGSSKIADLGCGKGSDAVHFALNGLDVTAVDFSAQALNALRQNALSKQVNDKIRVVGKSLTDLDLGDASFDCVYSHNALHYFDNESFKKVLNRANNMLRPGGVIAFKVKSKDDPLNKNSRTLTSLVEVDGVEMNFFSKDFLQAALRDFNVLRLEKRIELNADKKNEVFYEVIAQKI